MLINFCEESSRITGLQLFILLCLRKCSKARAFHSLTVLRDHLHRKILLIYPGLTPLQQAKVDAANELLLDQYGVQDPLFTDGAVELNRKKKLKQQLVAYFC